MYTLSSFGSAGTAVAASPEPALTRVLVAGEQMLLLEGLATLCNTIPGCSVVAQSPAANRRCPISSGWRRTSRFSIWI